MTTTADPVRPRRIGIFGGTFDPPHRGHVAVAREVADALELDSMLWVVARRSPHKPERVLTDDGLRLQMVRIAVQADPRFEASDVELRREAPSYTVDTLRELRAHSEAGTELYLVIGADQYRAFHDWHRPDEILGLATVAVMDRGGEGMDGERAKGGRMVRVPVTRIDVSSTQVRKATARGEDVAALVPPGVDEIIRAHDLYRP